MAAHEHQGMQIALIIFVILTISLGVTSFWFFDQFKNEQKKSQSELKHAQKAESDQKQAVEDLDKLKRMMNFGTRDEVGPIETAFKKDMETYAKTYPESSQHYRFIVAELDKQLKKKNEQLIDSNLRVQELEAKIKKDEADKNAELAKYQQSNDKTNQDATGERNKFNQDRDVLKKADTELAKKLEDKRKDFDDAAIKATKEVEELSSRIASLTTRLTVMVDKGKKEDIDAEQSDGKVTWVNQRARVVWLNLGADDGLRRQISFTVIGADENNPLKADKKGSVEVTRVLDRHLAEARIIDDSPSNPIMPGDNIYSVAWQPGRAEHFALLGFMDVDKDGLSDRQLIRDIIALNGGIVDAEVKDDGSKTGTMSIQTRYMVLGERPTEKSSAETLRAMSEFLTEAKLLPIKTISVPELIEYLGYKAKERTIPLGDDARGRDFKPRAPEGVQRKSSNNMFQKRRSTPTSGTKSAY